MELLYYMLRNSFWMGSLCNSTLCPEAAKFGAMKIIIWVYIFVTGELFLNIAK